MKAPANYILLFFLSIIQLLILKQTSFIAVGIQIYGIKADIYDIKEDFLWHEGRFYGNKANVKVKALKHGNVQDSMYIQCL